MGRVTVVTGANKGIGYAIVKNLALSDKSLTVVLTARSEARGRQAVSSLNLPNVLFRPLDVTNQTSVNALKDWIEKRYDGVDILINNAGYRYKGEEFNEEIARKSVDVNFRGIVNMWKAMRGLLKDGGSRVINVSSRSGDLKTITNDDLKRRFVAKDLTVKAVEELMRQFVSDVREGKAKENGWPNNAYAVSKLGATALTRAMANEVKNKSIPVFACCPGLVKTDMSYSWAPLTTDEGSETPIFLATAPTAENKLQSGGFYAEKAFLDYEKGFELPAYVWEAYANRKQDD